MFNRDSQLIYEAYENSKQPTIRGVTELNGMMQEIFASNGVQPATENHNDVVKAIEQIERTNHVDGKRLRQLLTEWETAFARENVKKPHLDEPVEAMGGNDVSDLTPMV